MVYAQCLGLKASLNQRGGPHGLCSCDVSPVFLARLWTSLAKQGATGKPTAAVGGEGGGRLEVEADGSHKWMGATNLPKATVSDEEGKRERGPALLRSSLLDYHAACLDHLYKT